MSKDIYKEWKAKQEDIDYNLEELISYQDLRGWLVNQLEKTDKRLSTDVNSLNTLLAILDLSAVVVNGEGSDSQEANSKIYYWLS